jgi:hypothetical protein
MRPHLNKSQQAKRHLSYAKFATDTLRYTKDGDFIPSNHFTPDSRSPCNAPFYAIIGLGSVKESYAVDSQGQNSSENDLQQASFELSEVSIPLLHGPRLREAFVRIPWISHIFDARCSQ